MLASAERARLSIGDQSFHIAKIFDREIKHIREEGGEREKERGEHVGSLARLGYGLIYRPVTRTRWTCRA